MPPASHQQQQQQYRPTPYIHACRPACTQAGYIASDRCTRAGRHMELIIHGRVLLMRGLNSYCIY